MLYRVLGKTGLRVSQLGFGAMRLPMVGEGKDQRVDRALAVPMIHRAFEGGINYIDTAVGYCNGDSQRAVGDALKGWRDRIVVSTKNHDYGQDEKTWWQNLEDSLERLQVEYIDVYNHHGLTWQLYTENVEPRVSKWMAKAKDQGLIKHICASFHDKNDALMKIVDTGYVASITLQYNMLDRQLAEGIAHAHEKGIGIVVMGPVGGGRFGENTEALDGIVASVKRVPELALRFVLANPNVSMALSGMSTIEQVEENLKVPETTQPEAGEQKPEAPKTEPREQPRQPGSQPGVRGPEPGRQEVQPVPQERREQPGQRENQPQMRRPEASQPGPPPNVQPTPPPRTERPQAVESRPETRPERPEATPAPPVPPTAGPQNVEPGRGPAKPKEKEPQERETQPPE